VTSLLAIGDMHLGRPPAALPADLRSRQAELGPEVAWSRAVDSAIEHHVDAVLLAGDLVDRERDFFHAYGELKNGIRRLAEAGIPVLAVAGNHDTEILPRLAEEIDGLELLGVDGQWQRHALAELTVLGWSFPRPQVRISPLDSLPQIADDEVVIGLLHCDVDQSESPYAPVSKQALDKASVNAWLLGHIHRPDDLDSNRPSGYLGSVTALRASETGPRGPWLIQVQGRDFAADHLPLAPLRFEVLELDCSELDDPGGLAQAIIAAAREPISKLGQSKTAPRAVGLRVKLTGRTRAAAALADAAAELDAETPCWDEVGIRCFIHRIELAVMPDIDLRRLARQSDPCGLLAQRLLALDRPDSEEYHRLVRLGREAMLPLLNAPEFRELDGQPDDQTVADWIKQAGRLTLIRLVGQREDQP